MNSHGDHSDLWDYVEGLQAQMHELTDRILALEQQTPQAQRLQHEADLAASGYDNLYEGEAPVGADRHGSSCQCLYCYHDPDDYAPGPECDDQGGMSEYPAGITDDRERS